MTAPTAVGPERRAPDAGIAPDPGRLPAPGRQVPADVAAPSAPPTRPPRPAPVAVLVTAKAVCLLAVLLLGFPAYLLGLSGLQEARDQDTLYATLRGRLATATAPLGGDIAEGSPVAVLALPRLHVRDVVVEGTAAGVLVSGPGHRRDTPLPGQRGVSVIAGRRTTHGAPFAGLDRLRPGDDLSVTTGQGTAAYTVQQLQRSGLPVPPGALPADRLMLVTTDPALDPERALVVVAALRSPAFPGGRPRVQLRAEERSLTGDRSELVPLVLWGQVLLVALAATTWLYVRWGRWSAWLVTTPVLVGVLWNVYDHLSRLLPNTY